MLFPLYASPLHARLAAADGYPRRAAHGGLDLDRPEPPGLLRRAQPRHRRRRLLWRQGTRGLAARRADRDRQPHVPWCRRRAARGHPARRRQPRRHSSPSLHARPAQGTSWFGVPALELPRVCEAADPARTTDPSKRLVLARGVMDAIRIVVPNAISLSIGLLELLVLDRVGGRLGIPTMIAFAPLVMLSSGLLSAGIAVAIKWLAHRSLPPRRAPAVVAVRVARRARQLRSRAARRRVAAALCARHAP